MGDGGRGDDDVVGHGWVVVSLRTGLIVSSEKRATFVRWWSMAHTSMGMGERSAIAVYHDTSPS